MTCDDISIAVFPDLRFLSMGVGGSDYRLLLISPMPAEYGHATPYRSSGRALDGSPQIRETTCIRENANVHFFKSIRDHRNHG